MLEKKWEYNEQVRQHFLDLRKLMIQLEDRYYTGCPRRNLPDFGRVFYVKVYRYNPKHLYLKLNGYGDNGQRKVRSSCGST